MEESERIWDLRKQLHAVIDDYVDALVQYATREGRKSGLDEMTPHTTMFKEQQRINERTSS